MQIALLEDEPSIQEMLRLALEDEGYTVTTYPTADTCLNALFTSAQEQTKKPIDLLIVDWRLSGSIPGTEVIRQLRNDSSFASLPIILTTAAAFNKTDELDDLHVTLLEKPFAVEEMVNMIRDLVERSSTSRTNC